MITTILIIIGIIVLLILIKFLKPYFVKYDTTCVFTGGLGSGKTLEMTKTGNVLIRKMRFYKYYCYNFIEKWIKRPCRRMHNYLHAKHKSDYHKNAKHLKLAWEYNEFLRKNEKYFYYDEKHDRMKKYYTFKQYRKKPLLYTNYPVHFKPHFWSKKREWSRVLKPGHVYLLKEIREYSVVMIDEFPQFINQYMWNNKLIQDNANEFISFFRHYIGGYLLITAQSTQDIVVEFRRKLNQAIYCFDFKKHLFGLFYTNRMADVILADSTTSMNLTQIEEETKIHFGLFPPKRTYDTRCYSIRYKEIFEKAWLNQTEFDKLKTNRILRAKFYLSPLDKSTTKEQKTEMNEKAEQLERE